jgi:predicted nucleic-acid-binding Zn-ribbon protein
MGGCDLEEGDIVCPKCGNDNFDIEHMYIEPLGFKCLRCGYDSRDSKLK